jgi:Suppressor of fused protein (SUFU)
MLTWMRNLLNTPREADRKQRLWDARIAALEDVLGKCDGTVCYAAAPMHRQGFADVLRFRDYTKGITYVTCDLIGNEKQVPNRWGHYELMICMNEENDWAPQFLSRLAQYTHEATLHPGDTMDIEDVRPPGSTVAAVIFARPEPPADSFSVLGAPANLVLCIGITATEFAASKNFGSGVILRMLKDRSIYPLTMMQRESMT